MYLSNTVCCFAETPDTQAFYCSRNYGSQVKSLQNIRTLTNPNTVRKAGSPEEYQQWSKNQPCSITRCESDNYFVPVKRAFSPYDSRYLGVVMSEPVMHLYNDHGLRVVFRYYGVSHKYESEDSARAWLYQTAVELLHRWLRERTRSCQRR